MVHLPYATGGLRYDIGLPFLNTTPFDLTIVQVAQSILGDRLLGIQAGEIPLANSSRRAVSDVFLRQ